MQNVVVVPAPYRSSSTGVSRAPSCNDKLVRDSDMSKYSEPSIMLDSEVNASIVVEIVYRLVAQWITSDFTV